MTLRGREEAALTHRRPAIQTRHIRFSTGFIEENELIDVGETTGNPKVQASPRNVRTILLGGAKRFFLSDQPSFRTARHTPMRLQRSSIS